MADTEFWIQELTQRCALIRETLRDVERRLTERMDAIERALYTKKIVRGWDAAARVLDSTGPTVRRMFQTDTRFPRPSKVAVFKSGRTRPEWQLSALLEYKMRGGR